MENLEINHAWIPKPQSGRALLGFASSDSSNHICHSTLDSDDFTEEEALSQRFESVGLGSNEDDSISGGRLLLPLRPYADDCQYYLRTGTCKFELNCRYNHPVRRTNQKAGGKEKENDKAKAKERLFEKPQNIECKFYLTAEGCKYGKSCRYNHSKDESEITPPELNFLGLPIRLGEKECPFYMRNGSCGYGARCKFHHPDATDVGGYDPDNSTPGDEYIFHPGNYNSESIPLHVLGASQSDEASWSTHMLSNSPEPYEDNHSSYMPMMNFTPQDALQTPEWNGYQAPCFPEEMTRHPLSAPAAKSLTEIGDMSDHVEEFPERPGQPECDYFMRTGYCKFKSACRYHHPMNQADCVLSDNGLPLRPGRKICWHYEQFGICKFGRACLFNHPENDSSTYPSGSPSESP